MGITIQFYIMEFNHLCRICIKWWMDDYVDLQPVEDDELINKLKKQRWFDKININYNWWEKIK